MKCFSYRERDYAFGQAMLTLRTAIGLTQAGLAEILGISRRAVSEWEAGSSYPKAKHLKQFIEIGVQQQSFPAGREAEEIRLLWKAAHQKGLLDEQWLTALLEQARPANGPPSTQHSQPQCVEETHKEASTVSARKELVPTQRSVGSPSVVSPPTAPPAAVSGPRVDWRDALAVPTFYGREQELAQLFQWTVQDHCHVVSVLGMGGIGKSALSIRLMHHITEHFEIVLFRSLRDAPSCAALLDDCLQTISPQPLPSVPASLERRISQLLDLMRKGRIFLVLDNLEGLLDDGDTQGRFRPGFEAYDLLLRRVAETIHQSCLLLTSREKPAVLRSIEGKHSPVRSLRLSGLEIAACQQLFAEKEVSGPSQEQVRLAEIYAGNPLALKIVAEIIVELFASQIGQFLTEETVLFGSIAHLLASGANDGTIQLWDPASGTIRQTFTDEEGAVYSLAWSPDGRLLASGNIEGKIRLWQIQGAQPAFQV